MAAPQAGPLATGEIGTTLWQLALARPQLVAAHLAGYAALLHEEAAGSAVLLRRQAGLLALVHGSLLTTVVLTGMALMLWAALPTGSLAQPWVLLAVPALPLLVGLWALLAWRRVPVLPAWLTLREQFEADLTLLKSRGH